MEEPRLTPEQEHQLYEKLMRAIFTDQATICRPYIAEEGKLLSLKEGVRRILETLPDLGIWTKQRQIRVLNLRFGLEDGKTRTLKEVGKELSLRPEQIRQVEAKALRILRHPSRSKFLSSFRTPSPRDIEQLEQRIRVLYEEKERLNQEYQRLREIIGRIGNDIQEALSWNYDQMADERAFKEAFDKVVSLFPSVFKWRTEQLLSQLGITRLSQLKEKRTREEIGPKIGLGGERFLEKVVEAAETQRASS